MKKVPLFYWSSILFEGKAKENYGDLLSMYIVERVANREVIYYNAAKKRKSLFQQKHIVAIGSIMSYVTKKSYVWGSGIISAKDTCKEGTFLAVRGPKSRERMLELGFSCPKVYGDPALLLPTHYSPSIEKKYSLGIIPHYVDYKKVHDWYKDEPNVLVIDLLGNDIEAITNQILSCEKTISSSLHGIIVSQAYNIPSVWVRFSEKLTGDNIKFEDYFLSVGLTPYEGNLLQEKITFDKMITFKFETIARDTYKSVTEQLLNSFPTSL
jgi:pyruvyltransferase